MAREISTSEKIYGYISSNKMFCLFVFMICVLFAMFLHQQGRVTMAKKPAFAQQKYPVSTNISKGNNKNKKKKKKTCEAELLNKTSKKVEQEEPLKKNEKKRKKNKKKVENEDDYKQISDRNLDGDDGLGEWKVVSKQQPRKKRQSGDNPNHETSTLYYTMPSTAKDVAPRFARAAGEEWKETRTNSRRRVTSNTPPHFKSTRSTPTSQLSRDGGMQRTKSNMSITSACASPAPVQKWNLNFDAPKHKTPAAKSSLVENSENKKWSLTNTESRSSHQEPQSAFKSFFDGTSITSDPWNNNTSTSSWSTGNKSSTVWPASSCQADTSSRDLKWTSSSNIGAAKEQLSSISNEFFSTSPPASVATSAAEKNFFLPCGLLGGSESDLYSRKDADRGSDFTLPSLGSTFSNFKAVPHTTNVGSASFMPRHNDESGHQLWRGNDPLTSRDFGRSNQNFGGYGGWGNYDFSYSNTSLFSPSTKSLWSTGRDELNSYTSSITPTFFQPQPDLLFQLPLADNRAKKEEIKQEKTEQKQVKKEVCSPPVEVNPWNKDPNMQCFDDDGQVNEDWAAPEESWSNVNEEWELPVIKQKPEPKYFNSSSDENAKLRNLNFESSSKKTKRRRKKKNQNTNHTNTVVGCSPNPPFAATSFHHQPPAVTSQSNDCSFSHFGSGDSDGSTGLKKRKNVSKTTSQ